MTTAMTQAENRFYRTAADAAEVDATRLSIEAFESAGTLTAELLRIGAAYGFRMDNSREAVRAAVRLAVVLLPVLVPPDVVDEPIRETSNVVAIQGGQLKIGDILVDDDHLVHLVKQIRPATEQERMRVGREDLVVAVTAGGREFEFFPDGQLYIVERPNGGEPCEH